MNPFIRKISSLLVGDRGRFPVANQKAVKKETGDSPVSLNNKETEDGSVFLNNKEIEDGSVFLSTKEAGNRSLLLRTEIFQPADASESGTLKIFCSPLSGGTVSLAPMEEVFIGTDPDESSLIVEGTGISRKHCCLSYNPRSHTYLLMDCSTNGTYLTDGRRLPKHHLMEVEAGTEFYLSEPENRFRAG